MAFSEFLADRVAQFFNEKSIPFEAKKMMGGLCFMIDGKMCVGINGEEVMARIHPDLYEESLKKDGCKEMNFTGRPMKGFLYLTNEAIDLEDNLYYWLQLALDFNSLAKASKKNTKRGAS
jgi:TfoX/Sxy family transcriptional regulator of competence genes